MTTLVSFIGNPAKGAHRHGNQRNSSVPAIQEYVTTDYRFEDGFTSNAMFFGWAALQHLRSKGLELSRWLIIGTPTSGWAMLADVALEADNTSLDAAVAWVERSKASRDTGTIQDQHLIEFESHFGRAVGVDSRLRSVVDSSDEVFACLHDNLEANEHVIVDITHGFRTIPIRSVLALGALRWIKNIKVDDILYGGIEKRDRNDPNAPAPAVSLRGSARLADITPHLAAVELNDDLEAAALCAERMKIGNTTLHNALREASVFDSLLRLEDAESTLRSNDVAHDDAWTANTAVGIATAKTLRRAAGVGANLQRADRELRRAEEFLDRRDYLRALILLCEAIRRRAISSLKLEEQLKCEIRSIKMEVAFDRLESSPNCGFRSGLLSRLRRTRNQVVHVDEAHSDVQVLLDSPDKLRSMLRDAITDAKKKLFRHLG